MPQLAAPFDLPPVSLVGFLNGGVSVLTFSRPVVGVAGTEAGITCDGIGGNNCGVDTVGPSLTIHVNGWVVVGPLPGQPVDLVASAMSVLVPVDPPFTFVDSSVLAT